MDIVHKVLKWLDYNRYKALAIMMIGIIMIYGLACRSTTASLQDPAKKVDLAVFTAQARQEAAEMAQQRADLIAQIETFNAKAAQLEAAIAAGFDDLADQERIKAELFNLTGSVVTELISGNPTSPAAIIGTVLTALGLLGGFGALADSKRKDEIISQQKDRLAVIERIQK